MLSPPAVFSWAWRHWVLLKAEQELTQTTGFSLTTLTSSCFTKKLRFGGLFSRAPQGVSCQVTPRFLCTPGDTAYLTALSLPFLSVPVWVTLWLALAYFVPIQAATGPKMQGIPDAKLLPPCLQGSPDFRTS